MEGAIRTITLIVGEDEGVLAGVAGVIRGTGLAVIYVAQVAFALELGRICCTLTSIIEDSVG